MSLRRRDLGEDATQRMRNAFLAGDTLAEIGARFGVSHVAVWKRLRKLGVDTHRPQHYRRNPPELAEELRKLRARGLTWRDVGRCANMTGVNAWRIVRNADIWESGNRTKR